MSGVLSGLASLGIDKIKIFGKGFHITDKKVKQLIKYKDYLTPKQKQDIVIGFENRIWCPHKTYESTMGIRYWYYSC